MKTKLLKKQSMNKTLPTTMKVKVKMPVRKKVHELIHEEDTEAATTEDGACSEVVVAKVFLVHILLDQEVFSEATLDFPIEVFRVGADLPSYPIPGALRWDSEAHDLLQESDHGHL